MFDKQVGNLWHLPFKRLKRLLKMNTPKHPGACETAPTNYTTCSYMNKKISVLTRSVKMLNMFIHRS